MNHAALDALLDYHYWARDRMLAAVAALPPDAYAKDLGSSFRSIRDTVVHIYAAEWVWHSRWRGVSPTEPVTPDQFPDVASITPVWRELEERVRQLIRETAEADLAQELDYRLLSGTPGRSVFWQMVQHVVNHAAFHRGQVTTMLRQVGAPAPASQDLITFYRERSAVV